VSPLITVTLSVLAVIYYPGCDRWTPARSRFDRFDYIYHR
jgi:hypothetical protein